MAVDVVRDSAGVGRVGFHHRRLRTMPVAMFRRKTDQVYATLQQVQRRISQQTQGGADHLEREITFTPPAKAGAPVPSSSAGEAPPVLTSPSAPVGAPPIEPEPAPVPPVVNDAPLVDTSPPIDAPVAPVPVPSFAATWPSSPARPSLSLPWEVATILFLLWVASLVGVYFIGHQVGKRATALAQGPQLGSPQGRVENSPTASARRSLLVLSSVSKATPEAERKLKANADMLNNHARNHASQGYQPWFGVRKPTNGGLQLVFGLADGQAGVDRDAFTAFAEALIRAGYKDAHWIPLD